MKLPSVYNRQGRGLDIKMTPMIDVVFLLLVFFVWTVNLKMPELAIESSLAAAKGSKPIKWEDVVKEDRDYEEITVRIVRENDRSQIYIEYKELNTKRRKPIERAMDLVEDLSPSAEAKPDAPVTVAADGAVEYDVFVDVVDALKLAGFTNFAFATVKKT